MSAIQSQTHVHEQPMNARSVINPYLARLHAHAAQIGWRCLSDAWTGTDSVYPFKKLDLFVTRLSQPISFLEAGERMGSNADDSKGRVMAYRAWLLQFDPIGQW